MACDCAPCLSGRADVGCSYRFTTPAHQTMHCARCYALVMQSPGSWGTVNYRCPEHGRVNDVIPPKDIAARARNLLDVPLSELALLAQVAR